MEERHVFEVWEYSIASISSMNSAAATIKASRVGLVAEEGELFVKVADLCARPSGEILSGKAARFAHFVGKDQGRRRIGAHAPSARAGVGKESLFLSNDYATPSRGQEAMKSLTDGCEALLT